VRVPATPNSTETQAVLSHSQTCVPRYVLIRADVYERVRDVIEPRSGEELHVQEGVGKSQEAFTRDLPEVLKVRRLRGKYVAYHGSERIGIAGDDAPLIRECMRRGLKRDEYDILIIKPQSPEPEKIDYPSCWDEA
jgi:hypothetical protein